ncbi:Hpt domain-containing protein [Thalassotalea aquiviva]|uniref:Hpt domain-containing protein n=1 Tax=Thalassotalea aquiviva TaxID=3242415 RepID=UPI00352B764A
MYYESYNQSLIIGYSPHASHSKINTHLMDYEKEVLVMQEKLELFWSIFEDDKESAVEICSMFCSYVPELFNTIDEAISQQDVETVKKTVHSLKGTLGYLGFEAENKQVVELEESLEDSPLVDILQPYQELKLHLESVVQMLSNEVLA